MLLRRRLFWLWVVAVLLRAGPAAAQAPVPLSLDDAVARGLAAAPRLAEARARVAAATATVESRETLRLPIFNTSASYVRMNHVEEFGLPQAGGGSKILFPDIPNTYRVRAELIVPIFPMDRVAGQIASVVADRRVVEAERDVSAGDLVFEITRAYWTLVTARETVRVVELALQRTGAWVVDVRSRVDAGVLGPNDLLSAEARRSRESVQLIQARNGAEMAQVDLARLAGLDGGAVITTTTSLDVPLPAAVELASRPIDALVASALDHRTEREALRQRAASAEGLGIAAATAALPQIGVIAGLQPSRPNMQFAPKTDVWRTSWDLGVSLTWQPWDHGKARADQAAATAHAQAWRERLREFDAVVGVEVRQRLLDVEAGRQAIAASTQAVTASAEARRVVEERFRAGVATSTDVQDAQVALLEAELERARLTAALRIGEARLVRVVGGR